MYTYILTQERMIQKGFTEYQIDAIVELGIASYVRGNVVILLNYWDPISDWEQLQRECFTCREALMARDINPWNAYFLICADEHCTQETCFLIERDASFLRKYVIRNEDDLTRIPFLDDTEIRDVNVDRSYLETEDKMIKQLMNIVESGDGFNGELNKNVLQTAVQMVISYMEGDRDEN